MNTSNCRKTSADALVIVGVTGDRRSLLKLSMAQLRKRVKDSIKESGNIDDRQALDHLLSLLQ